MTSFIRPRLRPLRTALAWSVLAWCALATAQPAAAQGDPWFARTREPRMAPFKDPAGRFSLDVPARDWLRVPGAGSTLLTLTEEDVEAAVVLEVVPMEVTLAPDDITALFADLEVRGVRAREKGSEGFVQRIIQTGGRRVAVVEYSRLGSKGAERVRQYSFPVGDKLFRLACSTRVQQLKKYSPVFAHMAATFTPAP